MATRVSNSLAVALRHPGVIAMIVAGVTIAVMLLAGSTDDFGSVEPARL